MKTDRQSLEKRIRALKRENLLLRQAIDQSNKQIIPEPKLNKLLRTEEAYEKVIENMSEGFMLAEIICNDAGKAIDYRILKVNKSFALQTGLNTKDVRGKRIQEVLSVIKVPWIDRVGRVALSGKKFKFETYDQKTKRHYKISCYQTKKMQFAVIFRDITLQKQSESLHIETIERFNMISEHSHSSYWEVDDKGLYTYVSPGSQALYGYAPREMLNKMHFYELHPEHGRKKIMEHAFKMFKQKVPIEDYVNKIVSRNGDIKWVNTNGLPVYDTQGHFKGYKGSDIDVTMRKKQQGIITQNIKEINDYKDKLQRLNNQLAESEELVKSDIARFLHDEIGQILSATHIQLSMLNELGDEKQILNSAATIQQQLKTAIDQCRERTYELNPPILKRYGLNDALKWKLNEVENTFQLRTSFESNNEKQNINTQLEQVLFKIVVELINNAVKHADASTIDVKLRADKKQIEIEVIDNGIGFNYNYKKDLSKKGSFGLFSIQERLSFFGGKLSIASANNSGTKASIIVPQHESM